MKKLLIIFLLFFTNLSAAEAVAEEVRALGVEASVAMGNVGVRQEAELIINKS